MNAITNIWNRIVGVWRDAFAGKEGPEWIIAKWASPVVALLLIWLAVWLIGKLFFLIILVAGIAACGWVAYTKYGANWNRPKT